MKRALLTIDINNFQRSNSKESMINAAERWEADFISYDKKPLGELYGVTFTKSFIDQILPDYDQIAFFDADCIIRSDAPTPFTLILPNKLRAVQNGNERIGNYTNTLNQHTYNLLRINQQQQMLDIIDRPDVYFNTGFMLADITTFRRLCHMVRCILPELNYDRFNAIYEQALFNYAARCISPDLNDSFFEYSEECWNYMYPSNLEVQTEWVYHISNDVENRNNVLDSLNWRIL
jgi:lipopolysaccharide biosynthesis glycosyltransferase